MKYVTFNSQAAMPVQPPPPRALRRDHVLSNKSKGVRISVTTCEKRVETCFIYLCDLVSKPDPIVKNLLVSDVLLTFQEYKIPVSRVFDDVSEFLYDVILWTFTVIVHEHRDIGSSKFTRGQESRTNTSDAKPSVHKIYVEG